MLNGSTLKICFLAIVGTLCFILVAATGLAVWGRLPIEMYERVLGILGIPALFGMISQAFIHANQTGGENVKQNSAVSDPVVGTDPSKS